MKHRCLLTKGSTSIINQQQSQSGELSHAIYNYGSFIYFGAFANIYTNKGTPTPPVIIYHTTTNKEQSRLCHRLY